jgi:hypothetical protein
MQQSAKNGKPSNVILRFFSELLFLLFIFGFPENIEFVQKFFRDQVTNSRKQ